MKRKIALLLSVLTLLTALGGCQVIEEDIELWTRPPESSEVLSTGPFTGKDDGETEAIHEPRSHFYMKDRLSVPVDSIVITDGSDGQKYALIDPKSIAAVLETVKLLEGTDPVSSRGYYGFTYHVELFRGEESVWDFALCPEKDGLVTLTCGYFETVGGVDYPARYILGGCSYAVIEEVLQAEMLPTHGTPLPTPLSYSDIKLTLGEETISPARFFVYSTILSESASGEGTVITADGLGRYTFFNDPDADFEALPRLISDLESSTTIGLQPHCIIESPIEIYNLRFEPCYKADGKNTVTTLEELKLLPAGEYIIVFGERYQYSYAENGTQHEIDSLYDCIFRLTVRDTRPHYEYSKVSVHSGDESVNPISCFVVGVESVQYADGTGYDAEMDGGGYWVLSEAGTSILPRLTYCGDIGFDIPAHTTFSNSIYLFNTDYEPYREESIRPEELADLPAGEYVVVFEERYEYSYDAADGGENDCPIEGAVKYGTWLWYDCVFLLVVPEQ